VSLGGGAQTPRKGTSVLHVFGAVGHNVGMAPAHDFKLKLTRPIEPTGGPGVELATLEDAARFVALLKPWRQARPHWDFAAELLLKAAETGKGRDVEGRNGADGARVAG
jgi:hypothetical protein